MDPDDRLIAGLRDELRHSLAEMRLPPEFREELKGRMLVAPPSWWRRWLGAWPAISQHRGAVAAIAVAAIAVAVVVPLAASQKGPARSSPQYLVMIPPQMNGGGAHAANAAPATCEGGTIHLTVTPAQATLTPGRSAQFRVLETGSTCPLGATVRGPSAAGLSVKRVPLTANDASAPRAVYEVTWTGRSTAVLHGSKVATPAGSGGTGPLSPGAYEVRLEVSRSSARVSIAITIRK